MAFNEMSMNTNYVDARTPEERANEPKSVTTYVSSMNKDTLKEKGALKKVILGIACFGLGMIAGVIITPQEIIKTETIIKEKEVEKPRNEIYQDCYVQTVRVFGDYEKTGFGEYRYHAKNIETERLQAETENCINNYYE